MIALEHALELRVGGRLDDVLADADLRPMWESELAAMRQRILTMREKLHGIISAKVPGRNFDYFLTQRGMFSYTGLSAAQVDRLREEHAVYLIRSGRIEAVLDELRKMGHTPQVVGKTA